MCTTVAPMPMGSTNITAKQFCAVSTFMSWDLLQSFKLDAVWRINFSIPKIFVSSFLGKENTIDIGRIVGLKNLWLHL